jgi:hypothetical protein
MGTTAGRVRFRGRGLASLLLIVCLFILAGTAFAGPVSDEDSYFYPSYSSFKGKESGPFSATEKGNMYGLGLFFRVPLDTRIEGSENIEGSLGYDPRKISNTRIELYYGQSDYHVNDNSVPFSQTSFQGIRSTPGVSPTKYRGLRVEEDFGYRLHLPSGDYVEPFAGAGFLYQERRFGSSSTNVMGHAEELLNLHARFGVRGEMPVARETALFGEAGVLWPAFNYLKNNQGTSHRFRPKGTGDSETFGVRYAMYRFFLFHEGTSFSGATADGLTSPKSRTDAWGIRVGFGY